MSRDFSPLSFCFFFIIHHQPHLALIPQGHNRFRSRNWLRGDSCKTLIVYKKQKQIIEMSKALFDLPPWVPIRFLCPQTPHYGVATLDPHPRISVADPNLFARIRIRSNRLDPTTKCHKTRNKFNKLNLYFLKDWHCLCKYNQNNLNKKQKVMNKTKQSEF